LSPAARSGTTTAPAAASPATASRTAPSRASAGHVSLFVDANNDDVPTLRAPRW
jgi:hypothetical protein